MDYIDLEDYFKNVSDSASVNDRGYSIEEMLTLYDTVHNYQKEDPGNAKYWAYEFNLLVACRRGEIPPLSWNDVDLIRNQISFSHQLVEHRDNQTGERLLEIKDTPKNRKERFFPITPMLADFLDRLRENNAVYHPDSPYLFPREDTPYGIISLGEVYQVHRRACKNNNIELSKEFVRGTHAFRRVHETSAIDNGISRDQVGRIYGNIPKTILKHYELSAASAATAPVVDQVQRQLFAHSPS
ncbi:MAG: hypothetical protein IJ108_05065 [Eubacterium sp.]|nr:hypothetical protein [Eubacterium sp.]